MHNLARVFIAAGAGTFGAEFLEPKLVEWFKPSTDFARKATKAGAAAVTTASVYYALGFVMGGQKS